MNVHYVFCQILTPRSVMRGHSRAAVNTELELAKSGWMTSFVLAVNRVLTNASIYLGDCITAIIEKTLE